MSSLGLSKTELISVSHKPTTPPKVLECTAARNSACVDSLSFSEKSNKAPKISLYCALTGNLTDEQIAQINRTRVLPKNCKLVRARDSNDYLLDKYNLCYSPLCFSFSRYTKGRNSIPDGYVITKNIFGRAIAVPKAN